MRLRTILLFLFYSVVLPAQPPSRFYTTFGGNGEDVAHACQQTLDGNYIIAGSSSSSGNGQTDLYLMKMDSMGQMMWQKFIGGFGNEVANSVALLSDSGFVACGYTSSFGAGGYDLYIIRTDKFGNLIWQKTFGGQDWDFGNDIIITSDGNVLVVGYTSSFGSGKKDGYVVKCDLLGNLIWQKFFGGAEDEELRGVINTIDNFIGMVGYTDSGIDPLGDFYFLKIDLNGDTIFTKTYGNPGKSYLNDLIQRASGDYILVGAETYTDIAYTKSYMANYVANTNSFIWQGGYYASNNNESWVSVTQSIKGSDRVSYLRTVPVPAFEMQGNIFSNTGNGFFPSIVNSFGGSENEQMYSHQGTKDGGFICVGSTKSFNSSGQDIFIIKLDSTITTYMQLVEINEVKPYPSYKTIRQTESNIEIQFHIGQLPKSIEIINLEGRTLLTITKPVEIVEINKEPLSNTLLLFKFNYSDQKLHDRKSFSEMKNKENFIQFILIVLINIIIKCLFLDYSPFSYDESISVKDTLLDFGHIKHESEWDNNPPFYYYCLWVWLHIFPINEFNARLLSVIFISLAIGIFYLFSAKRYNKTVALSTTLLLSFSNFLMYYSQETRTYSLVLFLSIASTALFFEYFDKQKLITLIVLSIVNFLLIYSHYIAGLFVFFQYILLVLFLKKQATKGLLIETAIILLFVFLRFTKKQFQLIFGYGKNDDFWLKQATLNDLKNTFVAFYNSPFIALLFIASFLLAIYLLFREKKSSTDKLTFYCLSMGYISVLFLFLVNIFKPIFLDRYLIFSIPCATLLFVHTSLKLSKYSIILIAIISIQAVFSFNLKKEINMDYRAVANIVRYIYNKDDIVIINTSDNLNLFWYYYDKKTFLANKQLGSISEKTGVFALNDPVGLEKMTFQPNSKVILIQSFHKLNGRVDKVGQYLSKRFKKKYKTNFYRGVEFSIFKD